MATAEVIEMAPFSSGKGRVSSAPVRFSADSSNGLPFNNPFLLLVLLLIQNIQVQHEKLFASYADEGALQAQYTQSMTTWENDTQDMHDAIANAPQNPDTKTFTTGGIAVAIAALAATMIVLMCIPLIGTIAAAVLAAVCVTIAGVAIGEGLSGTGGGGTTTAGGPNLNEAQDSLGRSLTELQTAILPQDQTKIQQLQNQMTQITQTEVGPAQDMQSQDGQMIQNALRLMQASVVQLPV